MERFLRVPTLGLKMHLTINGDKTVFLSYYKSRLNCKSYYYVNEQRILTFKLHVAYLVNTSKMMSAMAYRFSRETNNFQYYIQIVNTYIMPILEYGSIIWYQNNKTREMELEKVYKYATRFAIRQNDRYINYNQRLKKLKLLSLRIRRILNSICIIDKIIKGDLKTNLIQVIESHKYENTFNIRNPPLFKSSITTLPIKSPLRLAMSSMNNYRTIYSHVVSTATNRINIKNRMINE